MLYRTHLPFCLVFIACAFGPSPSIARSKARSVHIVWDLTAGDDKRLSIEVTPANGTPEAPVTGPQAYTFVLEPDDRVVLVFKWTGPATTKGEIAYAVTGTNVDTKDLEALKKLITGAARAPEAIELAASRSETRAVTDPLLPGGKLTVTLTLKDKTGAGASETEVTVYTSGGVTLRIADRSPRFTVSTGLAVSNAPEPSVAIIKTPRVITFEKDGKTQQAYEQIIVLRDSNAKAQPIQSAVTFANFRIVDRLYASLGLQLNQKLFEEPLFGLTYRHPLAGTLGLNITGGAHPSRETEIVPSSGFAAGMTLDPSLGLTVDDIPVEKTYRWRYVFAFTVDF